MHQALFGKGLLEGQALHVDSDTYSDLEASSSLVVSLFVMVHGVSVMILSTLNLKRSVLLNLISLLAPPTQRPQTAVS